MLEWTWLLLVGLGVVVGAYGTIIGAGGGFVLVPVLLLLYPTQEPATITSISLAVVFFNAVSGSMAYWRQKRIDLETGLLFALATVPGAVIGALVVDQIPRHVFNLLFGALLVIVSVFITLRSRPVPGAEGLLENGKRWGYVTRRLEDSWGVTHAYTYHRPLGLAVSALVGLVSSLLGIGGGIIHVPALIQLLHFPAHIATATSQFMLAIMALAGTGVHLLKSEYSSGWEITIALAIGVVVGAQVGARLSQRIHGPLILRLLAVALTIVGLRLIAAGIL